MKGVNKRITGKILLLFSMIVFAFGVSTITAEAGSCSHSSCQCGTNSSGDGFSAGTSCSGTTCWYDPNDYNGQGCTGHDWYDDTGSTTYTEWVTRTSPTCTTAGEEMRGVGQIRRCRQSGCVGTLKKTYEETRAIPALGHLDTDVWHYFNTSLHKKYCKRCSVELHNEGHNWGSWNYQVDGYHYRNCVDRYACDAKEDGVYSFTVYFNANGGTLNGSSSKTMSGGSSTHSLGTTASRTGYSFMGWGNSQSWGCTRYSANESKQAYQWAAICGQSIQYGDSSGTLYAQWERTITYTFKYWSGSSGTSQKASVVWHNWDTADKTMTIPAASRGNRTRLGQTWTFDGFDLDASLKYTQEDVSRFVDVRCDIDDAKPTLQIPIGNLNVNCDKTYYAKYHTTVTLTYVDYATDQQKTRTQSKVAYMNWNYGNHTSPSFTTFTENIMRFTEASARCTHGFDSQSGDDNSTIRYTRCSLCKREQWDSVGWAFEAKASDARVSYAQGAIIPANSSGHDNVNRTLYGRYSKIVTLTYDYNGGTPIKANDVYTRNANAYDVEVATTTRFTLPSPTYITNGVTKYNLGAWTGTRVSANNDFNVSPSSAAKTNIVGKNTTSSANYGECFMFIPRVSDTIYASWTNQTAQTSIEPKVTVVKSAKWKTPTSDNSVVDFDNKQNIDINGRVVVTLDITIENKNGYQLTNFSINDYIDADLWTYIGNVTQSSGVYGYIYTQSNGGIYLTIRDTSATSSTYKVTYELQLKEDYWNVSSDKKLYINKHQDLNKYLNALTNKDAYSTYDSSKNYNSANGLVNYSNMYYCESESAEKSFLIANYTVKNGSVRGTRRNVHYSTPYVVMRPVNWSPIINSSSNKEVSQLSMQNGTNVYHNIDSAYRNTYFVQYDTKSVDSSNSTFNIYSNSSMRRSYNYNQITDNLLDIRTVDGKNQVIDNNIGLNIADSTTIQDSTNADANATKGEILKISAGNNTHNTVTAVNNVNYYTVKETTAKIVAGGRTMPAWIGQRATEAEFKFESETAINGKPAIIWTKKVYQDVKNYNVNGNVEYRYGGLTSVSTLYATNQDGLEMNIYPYVRTTNTMLNKKFETTRDTGALQNQRVNVTIDASDPIITPDDRIKTVSDEYGEWTESDGYIDINLVNNATNPVAQEHTLVFKFEDKVSGVNSPYATNEDWINTTSDNIVSDECHTV